MTGIVSRKALINKIVLAALAALALVWVLSGCGEAVVASVNGQNIAKSALDREIKFRLGSKAGDPGSQQYKSAEQQMTDVLVVQKIINAEAQKRGISISDAEINSAYSQEQQATGGADKLKSRMSDAGVSRDQLNDMLRDDLYFQKLFAAVTKSVPQVTDAEAQAYYNQHKTDGTFNKPETRHVRHILVADQKTAQSIKDQLDRGADFAALAKKYSTDASTKDNGGDLGDYPSQNSGLAPAFEQAMDKLGPGQTSGPVQTQYGWHIIRVDSISPPGLQPFDQVKDDLKRSLLLERQRGVFDKWLADTRSKYKISYSPGYEPAATQKVGAGSSTQP